MTNLPEEPKVIQGIDVSITDYPHHVAFDVGHVNGLIVNYKYFCGGSIVASRWLLSAAHCFISQNGTVRRKFNVLAGTDDITFRKDHFRVVKGFRIPKNFRDSGATNLNDIAMVLLAESLKFSKTVKAINFPQEGEDEEFYDKIVTVAGFGYYEYPKSVDFKWVSNASEKLKAVNLTLYRPKRCTEIFGNILFNQTRHLCAGSYSGEGLCYGDSGGGLLGKRWDGSWVLLGVAVRIKQADCRFQGPLAVFTRLITYLPWINESFEMYTSGI